MNMRRDARRHDTVAVQRHQGARTDELWAYRPDERVQTIDGPGRVIAVHDGPFQGAEEYEIALEGGLGGGRYDSAQVLGSAPATTASTAHTADQDYPELGTILYDRPDPAKLHYTAALQVQADDWHDHDYEDDEDYEPPKEKPTAQHTAITNSGKWAKETRDALHEDTQERGHDMRWKGVDLNAKGKAAHYVGECKNCGHSAVAGGGWTSSHGHVTTDARNTICEGPGSAWKTDMVHELMHQRMHDAVREFGQNIKNEQDKIWLRDQGFTALLSTAATDPSFRFHVTAAWADVRAKAKRIRSQGGVQITHASEAMVVGNVKGDHNVYETGLQRVPGRRQSVASYSCGCKWGAYHWGADDDLSRFAGRMCSHALALQYEAASRGMFGRDLTVDEARPQWVPSKVVVKYDIDSGQHVRAEASLKLVPEQAPLMVALASFYDDPEGLFQVQAAVNDLLGDGTGRSEPNVQPALSPTSPPNPNENPATAGPLSADDPRNWGSIEHDRIFPRFSAKHEAFWQALIPLVRAVAPQVIKTVGPQLVQNQMGKHPAKPAGEITVPDGTEATLHDEPEGALPETDGEDHEASLGDGNLTGGGGIGSIEPDPLERTGSMWDVEVAHGDNISALEDDTLSPNDQSVQTVGSRSANDIVAEFQKSAGAQALMGSSARTATAFSASERDSLINEAPGTQARNTDKLDIEGTHYALLEDDPAEDDSWLA